MPVNQVRVSAVPCYADCCADRSLIQSEARRTAAEQCCVPVCRAKSLADSSVFPEAFSQGSQLSRSLGRAHNLQRAAGQQDSTATSRYAADSAAEGAAACQSPRQQPCACAGLWLFCACWPQIPRPLCSPVLPAPILNRAFICCKLTSTLYLFGHYRCRETDSIKQ